MPLQMSKSLSAPEKIFRGMKAHLIQLLQEVRIRRQMWVWEAPVPTRRQRRYFGVGRMLAGVAEMVRKHRVWVEREQCRVVVRVGGDAYPSFVS
jgi:hypothetical protein